MEVLYLDQLFAVNFLVDYCIVLAAARISGVTLRRRRYALSALAGAVYAALSVLPGLAWLALAPMKILTGILMALIAFGGETRFWRCVLVFFGTAALFGGTVFAISMAAGTRPGQALRGITLRVLVPTFAVCYAVVSTVFRRRMRSVDRAIAPAEITVNGQTLALRAMVDSGNSLRDPATAMRAAVLSAETLVPCCGVLPRDPIEAVDTLRNRVAGVRLLPYTAVGTGGGLLPAFRPDRFVVAGKDAPLLIALSPTTVSSDGDYDLLLPGDYIM